MEEKKTIKISLTGVLLIIAIIIILIMSYLAYKFYNEKTTESKKVENLDKQVTNLESTLNEAQEKINNISNIVSNNETKANVTSSTNKTTNSVKQNNESSSQTSSSQNDDENIFVGKWHCDKVYENGEETSIMAVFGSSGAGNLTLNENGTFTNYLTRGKNSEWSDNGTYKVNRELWCAELTYEDGSTEKVSFVSTCDPDDKGQLVMDMGDYKLYLSK